MQFLWQNIKVDFQVHFSMAGIFEYNTDIDRKMIHVEVYRKLFPYLQAALTSFLTVVGFPNFVLQEFDLREDDINNIKPD